MLSVMQQNVLLSSSRAFSLSTPTFSLSTSINNSKPTQKKLQNARNTYAHSKPQLLRALFQSPRAWNLLPRSLHIIDSDLYLEFIFITSPFFICYHYKARNIHLYELCNGKNGVPNCIHQTMQNEVRFLLNSHVHQWLYEVTQPFNDQKTCQFFKKIPVWVVTVFRLHAHTSAHSIFGHTQIARTCKNL